MIPLLLVFMGFLLAVIVIMWQRIEFLTDAHDDIREQEHAKCIGAVMEFVGNQFAAKVLEAASRDWDSVEERSNGNMANARRKHSPTSPSVPAIWLMDRADRLRGESHE